MCMIFKSTSRMDLKINVASVQPMYVTHLESRIQSVSTVPQLLHRPPKPLSQLLMNSLAPCIGLHTVQVSGVSYMRDFILAEFHH